MLPTPPLSAIDLEHVLVHTREEWEEMRHQRLFVTGGTGFFGMWLLETFINANDAFELGASATVLTRDPERFMGKAPHIACRPDINILRGDVRNFTFPSERHDFLIHAATEASTRLNADDPVEMLEAVIGGTRRVLEFARSSGIRKVLLTSSGAVYGRQPQNLARIPETYCGAPDPLIAASAYGEAKRVAEHMLVVDAERSNYDAKIARCFAFVGPHLPLDANYAIGNFIRDAMAGGPIKIAGDGTPRRSYLYSADLALWLWTILFRGKRSTAYNVGSELDVSIGELADMVRAVVAPECKIAMAQRPIPGSAVERYVPAVDRVRDHLGLVPLIDLPTSIQRTLSWIRSATLN